jgi:enterochelin esterase-like enzyme
MKFRILILLFGAAVISAFAQPPAQVPAAPPGPAAAAPGRGGFPGGNLKSPEVAPDGRVTFRLRAPNAKEVFVLGVGQGSGPGGARLQMEKNEQGVWTATTNPMKPGIYQYSFSVDGARFNDPSNNRFQTGFGSVNQSRLHVPGPVIWEPAANIARGAITRHFYHSSVAGDDRDFWVYTPANYDAKRKQPYPIFFLLHGLGDESNSWIENGAANVILDNLIAQGKATPMIMVTTLGYGLPNGPASAMEPDMLANFTRTVLEEVLPQVEKQYNVAKDPNQRAIAGLSMGGAEATFTGLNNLDKFAWIGSFSGAYVMWPGIPRATGARAGAAAAPGAPGAAPAPAGRGGPQTISNEIIDKIFPKLDAKANLRIRLLWITCGTADGLIGVNRGFRDWLQSRDVKLTYVEVPDIGHVWPFWRQNLADFAPLLFQTK